jgi:hypothetical protein
MWGHEGAFPHAQGFGHDLLRQSSAATDCRHEGLRPGKNRLERLFVLLEPRGVYIRHVIGKDLHTTLMG